jgi:glycosyltransferase involved in cell wall biosynthesis
VQSKQLKKVCICIPSFTSGGAENHSFMIAKAFLYNNYKVIMLSFSHNKNTVKAIEAEGIKCMSYTNPILPNDSLYTKLKKLIKLILFLRTQKIDIAIASTYHVNYNLLVSWKLAGINKFYWRQAGIDDEIPVSKMERFFINEKINYLCNSNWVKEYIKKRHFLTDKTNIHVIHNAVFKREIKKTRDEWRKELGMNNDTVVLVMTANFFPEKDFTTLLKAFQIVIKQLPEQKLKLVLAGNAPGKSSAKYEAKALAYDLKLQDHTIFIDATDDVFGLYEASDIGVLSTLSEGFSNSLIEYMYSGLPVVTTNIPPNVEAFPEESKAFLFDLKNVEQCADKLMLLIKDEMLRKKIGTLNKEHAIKSYSEKRFFNEYKSLIESLK